MRQILRRLPFFERETRAAVAGETVTVRPYQIILWVSLSEKGVAGLGRDVPVFPAILDTANNHNFSIREEHFTAWSGLELAALPRQGQVHVTGQTVALVTANVWIHRNQPGERDLLAKGRPFCLEVSEGIIVYPRGVPNPARLPTLGLRGLVRSGLTLRVDGKPLTISLAA